MATLSTKEDAKSDGGSTVVSKRVSKINSRLERIASCLKRGDPVTQFATEKEMLGAELKYLDLKLKMSA